jgi:predicted esterase
MNPGSRYRKAAAFTITLALGVFAGRFVSGAVDSTSTPQPRPAMAGRLADHPTYLIYLPEGWKPEQEFPLVFALSPTADARSMISAWLSVANRHHWLVAASKEFRNGQQFAPSLKQIEAELNAVERDYAVNTRRVIFTGISGGGMGTHAVAKYYPNRVSALVINTGMMNAPFMTEDYPEGKLAVFLASPTDFRYTEMKRDRSFLEWHHWRTKWLEFAGGHRMAPAAAYEQAAEWLEENLPE